MIEIDMTDGTLPADFQATVDGLAADVLAGARELSPVELLDDAAQVLTAARILLQGRAHRSDYRAHEFDRLVGLAEQIVEASS